MATSFEPSVELKTQPDGKSVYFKNDGTRFQNNVTVKLCVSETYKVNVCFRPAMKLQKWMIQGAKVPFIQVLLNKGLEDLSVFTTAWTAEGFDVTRRGRREELQLFFELERGLTLTTKLQVKFYASRNRAASSKWGQPMHALDLLCDSHPGQTAIVVRRRSIL